MSNAREVTGVLATVWLVGLLAGGCVDNEASLKIRGIAAPQGSVEERSVTCGGGGGGGGGGTQVAVANYTCTEVEPGSAENFWGALGINLLRFEEGGGQRTTATVYHSKDQLCAKKANHSGAQPFASSYSNTYYRHESFIVTFDTVNQLKDSRESGTQGGGGGGGGGFELELDMNDIETRAVKMRFPNVSGTGPGGLGLDRDIRQSFVIDSGGGAQVMHVALFQPADFAGENSPLRRLHKKVVFDRTGLSTYNERARRTTVTIDAEIWIEGKTIGGREVQSNHLEVPIRLCGSGCGTTPMCDFESAG